MRRLLAAAVLLALAVAAALLSADVRSWQRTLRSGDAVYAAAPGNADWQARTRMPFRLAERVLGVGDDVAARRALRLYRAASQASGRGEITPVQANALRLAQAALAPVARSSDPARAAQARTLLGLLVLGGLAQGTDENHLQAAFIDLTDAVRVDPDDVTAKYDLELLLRLSARRGVKPVQPIGGGTGATGRRGGGNSAPGEGY